MPELLKFGSYPGFSIILTRLCCSEGLCLCLYKMLIMYLS